MRHCRLRAIYLRVVTGINPIVIGRGKGAWRIVEILSLGSLVLWITEVTLHALHSGTTLFPQKVNVALLSATAVKIVGLALVSLGLITFILAFLSFGNSWRIGIDRQKPGTLVTKGIFSITRNPIYLAFDLVVLWYVPDERYLVLSDLCVAGRASLSFPNPARRGIP